MLEALDNYTGPQRSFIRWLKNFGFYINNLTLYKGVILFLLILDLSRNGLLFEIRNFFSVLSEGGQTYEYIKLKNSCAAKKIHINVILRNLKRVCKIKRCLMPKKTNIYFTFKIH